MTDSPPPTSLSENLFRWRMATAKSLTAPYHFDGLNRLQGRSPPLAAVYPLTNLAASAAGGYRLKQAGVGQRANGNAKAHSCRWRQKPSRAHLYLYRSAETFQSLHDFLHFLKHARPYAIDGVALHTKRLCDYLYRFPVDCGADEHLLRAVVD